MPQPPDIGDIELRLEEWGRWVVERRSPGQCGSLEKRFRRRSREDDTPTGHVDWGLNPVRTPPPPMDPFRALEVERVMRHIPELHRKVLTLVYVFRFSRQIAVGRCGVPTKDGDDFFSDAQRMVVNAMRLRAATTVSDPRNRR
jgi:hypothetical protein